MAGELEMLRMLEPAIRPAGAPAPSVRPTTPIEQHDFEQLLEDARRAGEGEGLQFSAHARKRLDQMGVELTERQEAALSEAADKAGEKGARDSLMLMRQLGLIVNIPNRTVVTVLDQQRMQSGIVTQIDSTVWVDDPQAISENTTITPNHGSDPGGDSRTGNPGRLND